MVSNLNGIKSNIVLIGNDNYQREKKLYKNK